MGPSPHDPDRSERDRICAAMVEQAAKGGFKSAGIDDVVRSAGVDRAAFTRHFDSLEACFAAAWEAVDADLRHVMVTAFDRHGDWQDRLRDSLLAGLRYLAADEGRARFYVAEVLYVNNEMRDRQHAAMTRLALAIDLGREPSDADRPPPGISNAISGAIWHRVHQLVMAGRGSDLAAQVSRFMYLSVLPYRGSDAAQAELRRA